MEEFKLQAEEYFKNHKATLKIVDENTQILTWENPNSIYYSIEFIFRNNMIFVSGDLGNAVFECTWNPTWDYKWEKTFLGYLSEKCKMITDNVLQWSSEEALSDIKDAFGERFVELTDEEFEEFFNDVKDKQFVPFPCIESVHDMTQNPLLYNLRINKYLALDLCLVIASAYSSDTQEEFIKKMKEEIALNYYNNFTTWGITVNPRIGLYLWALRMAKEQLENQ